MKKIILITILLLGLTGCGTDSATSKTESSKKIDSSTSHSSTVQSTKASLSETSKKKTEQTVSSTSEEKNADAEFKELLSGIEYNKEYLTEEQVEELKETYKSSLNEEQYKELMKMLEGIHDGDT
ncbi:MAG: hypothetical protein ACLTXM_18510 [Enterococcus sp.]